MKNLCSIEDYTLVNTLYIFIGGTLCPSLTASAGLAGLILTPICSDIIYRCFNKLYQPKTDFLNFALSISCLLFTTQIFGQALLPLLVAPLLGFSVITTLVMSIEMFSYACGFDKDPNSIASYLNS